MIRRKKLFLYVPSLIAGGAERVAMLLAEGFVRQGRDVFLIVAKNVGEFANAPPEAVSVIDLACEKPIKGIADLAHQIRLHRPDACIAFGIQAGIAAALSKAAYRWKSILMIRNENNLRDEWRTATRVNRLIGPLLSRWAARRYGLVCVSSSLSAGSGGYLGLCTEKISTIINPVFAQPWPELGMRGSAELHPWLEDRRLPTFVAMGRLEYQKGFDVLLDAFARVLRQSDARLIIFGNGSQRQTLLERAQSLGIGRKLAMPGYTACPLEQMHRSTAFVLSSRFEGFGLVLVEALMSGTQVVATDCNYGPADVLEGGRYGYLVPTQDPAALAQTMLQCIHERPKPAPPKAWFRQFSADIAAQRHIEWLDRQGVGE